MQDSQIWFKPKPTHVDEYFEDFVDYLKQKNNSGDSLYVESIRLLKERVWLLVEERFNTPLYRQTKDEQALVFNTRLCGAWLLAISDSTDNERRQVMLTMINNMVVVCLQSTKKTLNQNSFAYRNVPRLIEMAMTLATHKVPAILSFRWDDISTFSLEIFMSKFVAMKFSRQSECYFEGNGLLLSSGGMLRLMPYGRQHYEKSVLMRDIAETCFIPEYNIGISADKDIQLKESQREDIDAIEMFVNGFVARQKTKKEIVVRHLKTYTDGDEVAVEVVEVGSSKIVLKTIDPAYNVVTGQLVLEQNLKIFSKIYPIHVWAKVLKVGERLNVRINTCNRTFSITNKFVEFLEETAVIDGCYDAYNRRVPGQLTLREFWTTEGFMVFVNLTEEEDEELRSGGLAVIAVTKYGTGQFCGCLYGEIDGYDVETRYINREDVCLPMLRRFINENSDIHLEQKGEQMDCVSGQFVKELCITLNVMQSRESNPLFRYRLLSVMRMLCVMAGFDLDDQYCIYLANYLKTLVLFAQAGHDEGRSVVQIQAPDDLKGEEAVTNGSDILAILSCFAKGYDETSGVLDPYIESGNETLSKIASLVQSYNRLFQLLEPKTLRGIKKQILNHLSVVTDGDSTLELANELEGVFGEEDDMKEFKESFMEAPGNAAQQNQPYNICRGICAMMNNRGGIIYLGVNDKGVPVGVKRDLYNLSKQLNVQPSLDQYMLYINKKGEDWLEEKYWKYVTLKPIAEHNVVSIVVEPYPYDLVCLKDGKAFLRKNNSSAPIMDEETKEDIRRRRQESLRKTDDKIIILQDAIQKERKVRLVGYRSNNSGKIANRMVEAFHIDENEFVQCYEPASDGVKVFRISRADRVVMTDESWADKAKHKRLSIDPFHMSGEEKIAIRLDLKLQAKNAIEEIYPGISDKYISQKDGDTWTLDAFAYNLEPLVVFYLGNAKYVEIVEANGLEEAVASYIRENIHFVMK